MHQAKYTVWSFTGKVCRERKKMCGVIVDPHAKEYNGCNAK